ncbi:MAG: hypothetical protein ACM3QX_03115 [Syntrophomonadaceae bacterium]
MKQINMLIAGGCFPVQDNIKEEDMYHQILRRKLMEGYNIHLSADILRYENLDRCLELIKNKASLRKPDLLLFHMRTEPVLPKIKLYNAYTSRSGKIKRSVRIFSKVIIRTSEESRSSGGGTADRTTGKFHNFLRELNYFSGILAFNSLGLEKQCLRLIREITEYCRSMNIELIITGPVSRPRSYYENRISERIDGFICRGVLGEKVKYIGLLGLENESKEFLFGEDLIKLNEKGHLRVAGLILNEMAGVFDN